MADPSVYAAVFTPPVVPLAGFNYLFHWNNRHVADVQWSPGTWADSRRKEFHVGQRNAHVGRLPSHFLRPVHQDLLPIDGVTPGGLSARTLVQAFLARERDTILALSGCLGRGGPSWRNGEMGGCSFRIIGGRVAYCSPCYLAR